jgi:hypothetical protein
MGPLGGLGNKAFTARDIFIHVTKMEVYKEAIEEGVQHSGIHTFPVSMQSPCLLCSRQLRMKVNQKSV